MIYSRGRGRIVVGFTTNRITIVYHHKSCEFMFLFSAIYGLWKKRKKETKTKTNKQEHIGGAMISVLGSRVVDRGFESRSG
jgi:hypothetical protein